MSTPKAKGARLGTRMRGALAERYHQRNKQHATLCYGFSIKAERDFVFPSEQHYAYALLTDANPRYVEVDYDPPELRGPAGYSLLAGTAVTRDGVKEFHMLSADRESVPPELAEGRAPALMVAFAREKHEKGRECRMRVITSDELWANALLVNNWHQAQAWVAQYRYISLKEAQMDAATSMHAQRRMTAGELMLDGGPAHVAAALLGVCQGRFDCDLHVMPFSMQTVFEARRRAG